MPKNVPSIKVTDRTSQRHLNHTVEKAWLQAVQKHNACPHGFERRCVKSEAEREADNTPHQTCTQCGKLKFIFWLIG